MHASVKIAQAVLRSMLHEHQTTLADWIALGLLLGLALTVIALVVLQIGNRQAYG